jgi:hypothetical protein
VHKEVVDMSPCPVFGIVSMMGVSDVQCWRVNIVNLLLSDQIHLHGLTNHVTYMSRTNETFFFMLGRGGFNTGYLVMSINNNVFLLSRQCVCA